MTSITKPRYGYPHLCQYCGETDPAKFYDKHKSIFKSCTLERRHINGEIERSNRKKTDRRYRLKPGEYDAIFAEQNGLCICCCNPETHKSKLGKPFHLHVDHDHTTGKIRGLLCHECNQALGLLHHDIQRISDLLLYALIKV